MTAGGNTTEFLYNDSGIRVQRATTGGATHYLVDAMNPTGYVQVLEELDATTGDPLMSYVIGDDVLGQITGSGSDPRWLLSDGHGSTRQLVAGVDDVTSRYNYDAYGVVLDSTVSTETSLCYCGEQFDEDVEQYYLRARYYDQNTGRFNRLDPFAGNNFDPQSLHKYAYAHCDPVNRVDPPGLNAFLYIVALVIVAVVLALVFWAFSRASGARGRRPTPQQQIAIDGAMETLKRNFSIYEERFDEVDVYIDYNLTPNQNILGTTPSIGQNTAGRFLIGPQFLDGNHHEELVCVLYAEFQHASLKMSEAEAEVDFQRFLRRMGWQDREPMSNWHHGVGGF